MTHGLVHDKFNILHCRISDVSGLSTTYKYFPGPWAVTAVRFHGSSSAVRRAAENLKELKSKSAGLSVSGSYLISFSCQSARVLLKCCVESYCDRAAICVMGSHLNKQHTSTDRLWTWSIPPLAALLSSTLLKTHTCTLEGMFRYQLADKWGWGWHFICLACTIAMMDLFWLYSEVITELDQIPLHVSNQRASVSCALNAAWDAFLQKTCMSFGEKMAGSPQNISLYSSTQFTVDLKTYSGGQNY